MNQETTRCFHQFHFVRFPTAGALHSSRLSRKVQLKLPWRWCNLGSSWKWTIEKEISWNFIVFRVYVSFQGGRIHGTGIRYLDPAPTDAIVANKGFISKCKPSSGGDWAPESWFILMPWCRLLQLLTQLLTRENIPGFARDNIKPWIILGWTFVHFAHTL